MILSPFQRYSSVSNSSLKKTKWIVSQHLVFNSKSKQIDYEWTRTLRAEKIPRVYLSPTITKSSGFVVDSTGTAVMAKKATAANMQHNCDIFSSFSKGGTWLREENSWMQAAFFLYAKWLEFFYLVPSMFFPLIWLKIWARNDAAMKIWSWLDKLHT